MSSNASFIRAVAGIAGLLAAGAVALPALAESDPMESAAACAAYDLHLVTLIEDHSVAGQTPPEVLTAAAMTVIDARIACREGRTDRGLELYKAVPLRPARATTFEQVSR